MNYFLDKRSNYLHQRVEKLISELVHLERGALVLYHSGCQFDPTQTPHLLSSIADQYESHAKSEISSDLPVPPTVFLIHKRKLFERHRIEDGSRGLCTLQKLPFELDKREHCWYRCCSYLKHKRSETRGNNVFLLLEAAVWSFLQLGHEKLTPTDVFVARHQACTYEYLDATHEYKETLPLECRSNKSLAQASVVSATYCHPKKIAFQALASAQINHIFWNYHWVPCKVLLPR